MPLRFKDLSIWKRSLGHFTHFWAGVSHVHVYACLRKAYHLPSHDQGARRDRKALRTIVDKRNAPE